MMSTIGSEVSAMWAYLKAIAIIVSLLGAYVALLPFTV